MIGGQLRLLELGQWHNKGINMALTHALSTNNYGESHLIVASSAANGTHTTLAGAMADAVSGDTIFLRDSVTENVTLTPGVNIVAWPTLEERGSVQVSITGKLTMTGAGTCNISGVRLITNSDFFLAVTGSAASVVNLTECDLVCNNNTGITFTSSSGSSKISINFCRGDFNTTGITLFASSASGNIAINYSYFFNGGSTVTASTISSGILVVFNSELTFPVTSSGTGFTGFYYSQINTASNATAWTAGGSGSQIAQFCLFTTGSGTAISVGSTVDITTCVINSSNAAAIAGAGTIHYSMLDFIGGSTAITTTTQSQNGSIRGITNGANPAAGFIGEIIESKVGSGSPVSLSSSGTVFNITSVALTPGVWDLSSQCQFAGGAVTGTQSFCVIATSNNGTGTIGDTSANTPTVSTTGSSHTMTIAAVRKVISANTSYYLNASCTYTVGSPTAFGRLTAVRVG